MDKSESPPVAATLSLHLKEVGLHSRQANRFGPLIDALSLQWHIEAEAIGVKALANEKNYGNRISEATRKPILRLLLLSEQQPSIDALERALSNRSLVAVPTLVAHRLDGASDWSIDAVLLPEDAPDPYQAKVPIRRFRASKASQLSADQLSSLRRELQSLEEASLASEPQVPPGLDGLVAIKQATDSRNLANRIGEAVGRKPGALVLRVPRSLVHAARQALASMRTSSPQTVLFLLIDDSNRRTLEELDMPPEESNNAAASSDRSPTSPPRSYRRLARADQLLRLFSLGAGGGDLFEERVKAPEDMPRFESQALHYVSGLLARKQSVLVVLTGNPGHGKTHLCRRLLTTGRDPGSVMPKLKADGLGEHLWEVECSALPVRVMRDLSDGLSADAAGQRLVELLADDSAHAIVCANEGKLRDAVGHRPTELAPILEALDLTLDQGATSARERSDIQVVNLNYQAAAPASGGFLDHALDHYLNHQAAWNVCRTCLAQDTCPILDNRNKLALSPALQKENKVHRERLRELVGIIEQGGYVLTFREALLLVAYLVTGGLSCKEVEEHHRARRRRSLDSRRLLPLLFEPSLSADQVERIEVLARMHRLDPGLVAIRSVDERVHRQLESSDEFGSGVFGDDNRQLFKSAELKRERAAHRTTIRAARRAAWLRAGDGDDNVDTTERLGLRHQRAVRSLLTGAEKGEVITIMRALIRGLHVIQGAVGVESLTSLHLVDPTFGRSGSHAAVVARSLRVKDLWLCGESEWWSRQHGASTPPVVKSVDWMDRRVLLIDTKDERVLLSLDRLTFEFVLSAGEGIVMRDFHASERRRILSRLARNAEQGRGSAEDDIRVLLARGGEGRLTVERDGQILLEVSG